MHDLRYAFRGIRRNPLAALTIVLTVALGLGLVTVVFTLLNSMLFRVNAVHDPDALVGVERPREPGAEEQIPFTRRQYEELKSETRVFVDVAALVRGNRSRIDGRPLICSLVSGNFFQMLGVSMAAGRWALRLEPKRWMKATAPRRAAEPEPGLCARRHCSTTRRNKRRAAP